MLLGGHRVLLITVVLNKGKTRSHGTFRECREAVAALASWGGERDKAGHRGRNQIPKGGMHHAEESGFYLMG